MEFFAFLPILIMILVYGGAFAILVYLIVQRIEDRRKEDFEKRDY